MGETIKKIYPFKLEPIYISSIWAGPRISEIRDLDTKDIGIAREVCAYKGSESIISSGPFKGQSVDKIIAKYKTLIMGDDKTDQLVRIAYMHALEDLSLQVHPNEELAKLIGDFEKSESWYILEAEPDSYVVTGTTLKSKEEVRKSCLDGTIEKHLIKTPVVTGDFVLIPAGLMHAFGKGIFGIEIGSFGGITYRLYDYGRPRTLDLDMGLKALNLKAKHSKESFPINNTVELDIQVGVEHELFKVEIIDVLDEFTIKTNNQYCILTCVLGSCEIYCEDNINMLKYTQTLFIPASAGTITIRGKCRILKSTKPI